jgi:hypothetical protein
MSHVKDLEELVELQARAIEALQQAAGALRIALEVIQKSHAEKGTQEKIVFVPQPALPAPATGPYVPATQPYFGGSTENPWGTAAGGIQWNGSAPGGLAYYVQNAQTALQNVQSNLTNWSKQMEYESHQGRMENS